MKSFIPPVLVVFCITLMIVTHILLSPEQIIQYPYNLTGALLIITGIFIGVRVGRQFKRVSTEIHTFKEPKKLVTNGLFKFTRNPIYLGFTVLLSGVALWMGTAISFLFPVLFWLAANFWYIPFEEENMRKTFGSAYQEYQRKVRRWL